MAEGAEAAPGPGPVVHLRAVGDDVVVEVIAEAGHASGRVMLIDGLPSSQADLDDPERVLFDYHLHLALLAVGLKPHGTDGLVVHVGGGGGTIARFLACREPQLRQVVVELAGVVLNAAQAELGLVASDRMRLVAGDGRAALAELESATATAVIGDAYAGASAPVHLLTQEYVAEVARVLRPDGTYLLNLVDRPPFAVIAPIIATVEAVFGASLAIGFEEVLAGRGGGNVLLAARRSPSLRADQLVAALAESPHPVVVRPAGEVVGSPTEVAVLRDGDPPPPMHEDALAAGREARAAARRRAGLPADPR